VALEAIWEEDGDTDSGHHKALASRTTAWKIKLLESAAATLEGDMLAHGQ
jgi:hypothetical protein